MLSQNLDDSLRRALALASSRGQPFAGLEYLLLALIDDPEARVALVACGVDIDRLRIALEAAVAEVAIPGESDAAPSTALQRVVQHAYVRMQMSDGKVLNGDDVLRSFFAEENSAATRALLQHGVTQQAVEKCISGRPA